MRSQASRGLGGESPEDRRGLLWLLRARRSLWPAVAAGPGTARLGYRSLAEVLES